MTNAHRLPLLVLAAVSLAAVACARSPYSRRYQSMGLDENEALARADRAAEQYRRRIRPVTDPATIERVTRVTTKLVAAAKTGPAGEHAARLSWETVVADDAGTEVAVLENGKIFLGGALVRLAKTDAELAWPIGRAVAQVLLRHSSERERPRFIPDAAAQALGLGPVSSPDLTPLELAQRNEADDVALLLAEDAGYDPEQVLPMLGRLGEHEREARLRNHLPELRSQLPRPATDDSPRP
jgi:predicted Zn-dependent protease